MIDVPPQRVIALLAQRRGALGRAERRAFLEACRDAPTRVAQHLVSSGVGLEQAAALVDEGRRIAERARAIAGVASLSDPVDRTLREALSDGIFDAWGLCVGLVDQACGGPAPDEVARGRWSSGKTVETAGGVVGVAAVEAATMLIESPEPGAPRFGMLPPVAEDAPRIGRYRVTGRLGVGGMWEVLAVQDADLGREVAVKVIRGKADERSLWKFVLEARVTGRLAHPSIVPVYELGRTDEGQLYFTMKRVEGRTLTAELADRSRRSDDRGDAESTRHGAALSRVLIDRLRILQSVCDAVAFAHSQGVIHRDLKPDNIMVGAFGEVLVCDWGLAKVLGDSSGPDPAADALVPLRGDGEAVVTLDGDVMGTPAYMPPEQADGRLDLIDERADVYALGAILYQVLCGLPPYVGLTPVSVLEQVQAGPPVPPTERATPGAHIPWELEAVATKAMARQPADRYASAAALRADVDAFLAGRLLVAARYTSVQRADKWARRNARAVGAAAVAVASLIGALAYTAVSARQQVRQLETSERAARAAELIAQVARDDARAERAIAVENYGEAKRMGALHRKRELARQEREDLWWTPLDRLTGALRELPTEARLHAVERDIERFCSEVEKLMADGPAFASALSLGQAAAKAAPRDSWLAFRAEILTELCHGLEELGVARGRATARGRAYSALRAGNQELAARWAQARTAIALSTETCANGVEAPTMGGFR